MDNRVFFVFYTSHCSLPPETPSLPSSSCRLCEQRGVHSPTPPGPSPNCNPSTSKLIDAAGVAKGGGLSQIKRQRDTNGRTYKQSGQPSI